MSAIVDSVAAIVSTTNARSAYDGVSAVAARRYNVPPLVDTPSDRAEFARAVVPADPSPAFEPANEEEGDRVEITVETLNRQLALSNRSLRFRIDADTEELQIQVVDSDRNRVIRSIPSDEMLRLSHRLRQYSGIGAMVDHSR